MAKDRSTCLKWCMAEQKCMIVIAATGVGIMGMTLFSMASSALNNDQVANDAAMSSEFSHGQMDLIKMIKAVLAFGLASVFASILGCCGACRENKICLCLYAIFGIKFAVAFIVLGTLSMSVLEVQAPNLIRSSNRICANAASMEANDLKCNNATAQTALNGLLPPTVAPPTTGATSRRLEEFLAGASDATENWFGPGTKGHAGAFAAARMIGQRAEQQAEQAFPEVFGFVEAEGRRLDAGTSEKQLVMKVGGNNPCGFIQGLCVPPEGFNPVTACICEGGKVPNSNTRGSFCNDWNADTAVGTTAAAGPEGKNWCYVSAGSLCDSSYESVTQMTGDIASSAPCEGSPDPRSKMVHDGIGFITLVNMEIYGTGVLCLISVMCACCLCCEIHTGKNAEQHSRELVAQSDSDEEEPALAGGRGEPSGAVHVTDDFVPGRGYRIQR